MWNRCNLNWFSTVKVVFRFQLEKKDSMKSAFFLLSDRHITICGEENFGAVLWVSGLMSKGLIVDLLSC